MGTLVYRIVNESDPPFSDASMLDACINPQFNGVFPDDPQLGILPEIRRNGTRIYLGMFNSIEEAASARETKLMELNNEANR